MNIGKRIIEERKRKGLSQTAFAELMGISLSSQRRYEAMERAPDTGYLESLRRNGVDVEYVLKGGKKSNYLSLFSGDGLLNLGHAVAELYAITPGELNAATDIANQAAAIYPDDNDAEKSVAAWDAAFFPEVARLMEKRLGSERKGEGVDSSMLAAVLKHLDDALLRLSTDLTTARKAQVATMLYRAFKASGKIDPTVIEEAVTLAAG